MYCLTLETTEFACSIQINLGSIAITKIMTEADGKTYINITSVLPPIYETKDYDK